MKVHVKTATREATSETFNVTQPELSNCSPVCRCPLPTACVVTDVEFSTKVIGSSPVVKSTVEDGSEVKVKVVVGAEVGVVWEAQCGR